MCYIAIPLVIMAVAAAYSAYSSYEQGKAQSKMYANQAQQQTDVGALKQADLDRQKEAALGHQRALYSASGVTLEGSPTDVLASTAGEFGRAKYDVQFGVDYDVNKSLASSSNASKAGTSAAIGTLLNYGSRAAMIGYGGGTGATAAAGYGMTATPGSYGGAVGNATDSAGNLLV